MYNSQEEADYFEGAAAQAEAEAEAEADFEREIGMVTVELEDFVKKHGIMMVKKIITEIEEKLKKSNSLN